MPFVGDSAKCGIQITMRANEKQFTRISLLNPVINMLRIIYDTRYCLLISGYELIRAK